MSSSSKVGKAWCLSKARDLSPTSVLDVGCGRGTYYDLLSPWVDAFWIGVEVFEPYASRYGLREKYDQLVIADVRFVDWRRIGPVDLAICGDVLEHMEKDEALRVWGDLRALAGHVLLSLPIGEYPQGPSAGNRFETHVSTWTAEECAALPGVLDYAVYSQIGVFLAKGAQ